ncbi:LLM class flavin-dependent oxidoreductase [uncultured Friedmanniella sp.]|uniref:LLM class flavin-dependent oxidoreductase n=1 Tax=uncultured Friedmanniella sp. TaxID=335381 RepID=UPI0035CC6216
MDYRHELAFGSFLTPASGDPEAVVALAQLSEQRGLDLVTFQDHPYQPAFLDTWTLLSYVAAATVQVTIAPNVANLPLRPPAVLARAAASLDLLSGGRVELGLGAGGFPDAVAAMGGPYRTGGEAVEAFDEAVQVIRAIWDTDTRGGARVRGRHYVVDGAKRGPAPAHRIGLWVGALKPRMLRLTGRVADGWLPSSSYLPPAELAAANAVIDQAAVEAGREPGAVRRLYNLMGTFGAGSGFLQGSAADWAEQLTELAVEEGVSTFILASDDPRSLTVFAEEVAPAVRSAVAAERSGLASRVPLSPKAPADAGGRPFDLVTTPDPGVRLSTELLWDEDERPTGPPVPANRRYRDADLASGARLVAVHDHLRAELEQIRGLVAQVLDGSIDPAAARGAINEMTVRQNSWTLGAYCAAYCRLVATHHTIEDQALFPRLRAADPQLAPVVDRLAYEHEIIHEVLERVDRGLVAVVNTDPSGEQLQRAVDALTDALLSHLSYEERELVEPLARLGILV